MKKETKGILSFIMAMACIVCILISNSTKDYLERNIFVIIWFALIILQIHYFELFQAFLIWLLKNKRKEE